MSSIFKNNHVVFAHLETGLGHVRVCDALKEGIPNDHYSVLYSSSKLLPKLHNLISKHRLFVKIMERFQTGRLEIITTTIFKLLANIGQKKLLSDVMTIINSQNKGRVLFVATHFAPALSIANLRKKISEKTKVEVSIAMYVTDDSPQRVWCLDTVQYIFVPSKKTKFVIDSYIRKYRQKPEVIVCAYPISPRITQKIGASIQNFRKDALNYKQTDIPINVIAPISGASVGIEKIIKLCKHLSQKKPNFKFFFVLLENELNLKYKHELESVANFEIHWSRNPHAAIEKYIGIYQNNTIAIEVTKPSELSFKSILSSTSVGGSIEAFLDPVGRQEYDNLDFLIAHKLMPNAQQNKILFENAHFLNNHIPSWKAISLSTETELACKELLYLIDTGIFQKMVLGKNIHIDENIETSPYGVSHFWNYLRERLES